MANLVLLAGVPGSGKSTWAQTFFAGKYRVVSPDSIRMRLYGSLLDAHQGDVQANNDRVFKVFHTDIQRALEHDVDVLADATHLTRRARHTVRQSAHGVSGAKTHLVVFKNLQQALQRNLARTADVRVPDKAQDRMVGNYYDLLHDLRDGEGGLYDSVTLIESFA